MASDLDQLVRALGEVSEAVRLRTVVERADGSRLTERQLRTLMMLDGDDPVMVGELAEHLGVTASTMSLNLSRLEREGLVRRSRDPDDRRVMNVTLTDDGARLRDAVPPVDLARADLLLRALRPSERRRAVEGLALLADAADRVRDREHTYLEDLTR